MTPEMIQLLYLVGALAVGWFLRHRGVGAPVVPAAPTSPATLPVPTLPGFPPSLPPGFPPLDVPPGWQPNWRVAGPHPVLDALSKYMLDQLAQALKTAPLTVTGTQSPAKAA